MLKMKQKACFWGLLWSVLALSCSQDDALEQSSLKSSSSKLPFVVKSLVPSSVSEYQYLAIFPDAVTVGLGKKDLALELNCDTDLNANRLLGRDPKSMLEQERLGFLQERGDGLLFLDADRAQELGIQQPQLFCQSSANPNSQAKPRIAQDTRQIIFGLDDGLTQAISVPAGCDGLQRGFELPGLMRGQKASDLLVEKKQLALTNEYVLNCGHDFKLPALKKGWELFSTDLGEIYISNGSKAEGITLQIETVDGMSAIDLLVDGFLNDAGPGTTPDPSFERAVAVARELKKSLGVTDLVTISNVDSLPPLVEGLKLSLCMLDCGESSATLIQHLNGEAVQSITLQDQRMLDGQLVKRWNYAPNKSLVFPECGRFGLESHMGLNMATQSGDWAQATQDLDWAQKAQKSRQLVNSGKQVPCLQNTARVCTKFITKKTVSSETDMKKLLSMQSCPQDSELLELRLRESLIIDNGTVDLSLGSLRSGVASSKAKGLRIVGERGFGIINQMSCKSGRLSCVAGSQQVLPVFQVQKDFDLQLESLTIDRPLPEEAGLSFIGVRVLAGGQLRTNGVKIGSAAVSGTSVDFKVGVSSEAARIYLTDTDIFAQSTAVEALNSRLVVWSKEPGKHAFAPLYVENASDVSEEVLKVFNKQKFQANVVLGGENAAAYIYGQTLAGPLAYRAAGAALVFSDEVRHLGLKPTAPQESAFFRDESGRSQSSITGGALDGYDRLLMARGNGTRMLITFPTRFRMNACGFSESDPDISLAYDPALHISGVRQTNPSLISVLLLDKQCQNI